MESTEIYPLVGLRQKTLNLKQVKIFTNRLYLRPSSLKDAQDIFENFTETVTQYMSPKPAKKIEETEEVIRSFQKKMLQGSDLFLTILKKGTEEFLGCCGLHCHSKPNTPELGVWIKEAVYGHGYGREAVHGLKNWAEQFIQYEYLNYPVDRNNHASRKIPQSLGGEVYEEKLIATMNGGTLDGVIYRIFPQIS